MAVGSCVERGVEPGVNRLSTGNLMLATLLALPFAVTELMTAVSVTRATHQDGQAEQERKKSLRRKVRAMVRDA
ncbi:hypothetical protein [Actimicrobium antarcticum]|uniref:Uncharacterized protein n=1 Tax=Actimicrobium antarcticum TaxID=1051899 RepID=A0ABP7SSB1_9BURK